MKIIRHIAVTAAALFICLGLPCLHFVNAGTLFSEGNDATAGASMDIPDTPSGDYLVLINREMHPLTEEEWTAFFSEKPVDVIMEDINCLASKGDIPGLMLCDRYIARLAENQMKVTVEDGTLVVSRAENHIFDIIIVSADVADIYDYSKVEDDPDIAVIRIHSDTEDTGD